MPQARRGTLPPARYRSGGGHGPSPTLSGSPAWLRSYVPFRFGFLPIPERAVLMSVKANANWIGLLAVVSAVAVHAAEIKAVSVVRAASGSFVSGHLVLTDNDGTGLRVKGEIRGLAPGMHGFHVHEYGDCSDTAAVLAGGHFNPGNAAHGDPTAAHPPAGG